MKRVLLQVILPSIIVLAVVAFLGDFLSLRYRIPNREPYDSVMVRELYAIKLKNKQTEFMMQPAAPQECVNSLFPHYGDPPCWYLKRHTRQQVDINSGQPHFWDR